MVSPLPLLPPPSSRTLTISRVGVGQRRIHNGAASHIGFITQSGQRWRLVMNQVALEMFVTSLKALHNIE
jgi:hypothetical protein